MEQPRTNAATCVIPMQPAVPNTPGTNPESTEFATKIQLKFDPLVAADNSQHAESDSMLKKICVFIFVLIICSIYHVLGFALVIGFMSWSHLNLLATFLGVIISDFLLWPFAMYNLSEEDFHLFFDCVLNSGLVGLLCALIRSIYKTRRAENAIQQQNNPNNGNDMALV